MKEVNQWEIATNKLAQRFVTTYWGNDAEWWWIGDDIGGVMQVNDDWFFDLNRIVEALKYKATFEQLDHYSQLETESRKRKLVNFKNFVQYGFEYL